MSRFMFNILNVTTPKNAAKKISGFVSNILNVTTPGNVAQKNPDLCLTF